MSQALNNSLFRLDSGKIKVSLTDLLKQNDYCMDVVGYQPILVIPLYMFSFIYLRFYMFDLFCRLQFYQNEVTVIDTHKFYFSVIGLVHNITENTNTVFSLRP